MLVRAYHVTYGLNISSTRCSNNYGPFQFPEKVIPLFVTNLIDGGKVPLYGDGLNVRDWLHVDDHCRGIAIVVAKGAAGQSYNIGGGLELTNREITERVLAAMGADWSSVLPVEDRKGHDRRYSVDDSRLRALLDDPKRSKADKQAALASLMADKASAEVQRLVDLLVENGRISAISGELAHQFEQLKLEAESSVDAFVSSAFKLTAAETKSLQAMLESRYGRKVNVSSTVDASLIGGVRIAVGDEVIDASVQGRLASMALTLQR
jgi:ATP synthase F1 delta subunit